MLIHVNLNERSYDIQVATEGPAGLGLFARQRSKAARVLLVTDQHVGPHHAGTICHVLESAGFSVYKETLPAGESVKSLESASRLYDTLADLRADRQTLIVPMGGGVIGDLVGFVAATFNRGLPMLMVPTTLLAMVDSSVGGKTGINHPKAKNLIGAFHQPVGVWIDTSMLATLPDREYRSGLAEVVKYGMILDADFFAFLEEHADAILSRKPECLRHIVSRSCRLKADVVERDERDESGLRAVLNYGHTFAHAFETVAGYGSWLHGEAVAAGMACAAHLAVKRGMFPMTILERQNALLKQFGLPVRPLRWPMSELLTVMRSDKKNVAGQLRLVLPVRLGGVKLFDDVSEEEAKETLEHCQAE